MNKKIVNTGLILILILISSFNSNQKDMIAHLVLDAKVLLGEGALWHPGEKKLYWIDIEGRSLHLYDPISNKDYSFPTGERIGTVVPVQNGGALVALQNGIHKININTGELELVVNPLKDVQMRFNDGKCDPAGRLWVGTLSLDGRKEASVLYRLDKDKTIHTVLDSVTISNGIVWSVDKKTMYYIDTPTSMVQAFDYDNKTGEISHQRVVVRIPKKDGYPDGMTIDAEGKLWIALWGGGAVARFDPITGKMLQKIKVPSPHTSSCAFGGENLDILYITTARVKLTHDELGKYPTSGGLFAVIPGVRGVPASFYKENL